MNKKIVFSLGIIVVLAAAGLLLLSKQSPQAIQNNGPHKIKIVTTLFPLYDMAKHISSDKADVSLLLPPGVEPHTFEPTPSDVIAINTADVFVYTGKFMEPWAADVIKGVTNKNLIVVDASQGTNIIPAVFRDANEPAGSLDPHIWLDFDNAKIMAKNIAQAVETKDPQNNSIYVQNLSDYDNSLTSLDTAYRTSLSNCQSREIVYAGHYAFGYLAKRYNLQYVAAQGVSPDAEPTANDLIALVNQVKQKNIKYVFYEELTSPKIADTIASETNAKLLLLNAAHNLSKTQFETGATFFDILNNNLANLKLGLECHS